MTLVLLLLLSLTAAQQTWTVANGFTAKYFIAGLTGGCISTNCPAPGPVGMIWDSQNRFYFTNVNCIYRIDKPLAGGPYTTSDAAVHNCFQVTEMSDLAFDGAGRLWAMSFTVSPSQLDPETLTVIQTLPGGNIGFGAATDPLTGDLFFNSYHAIYRISSTQANPIPTPYWSNPYQVPNNPVGDGLAFGPDGSLYLGEVFGPDSTLNNRYVAKVSGTNHGTPTATYIPVNGPSTPTADGVAVALDGSYVLANCHPYNANQPSEVLKINLDGSSETLFSDTAPYRADFGKVGPDGCYYFTHEPDSILGLCGASLFPGCTKMTSCPTGLNCGIISDGCGGSISCGSCTAPENCGGGGTDNVCGSCCIPKTSCPSGLNCGTISDGCGGTINCGSCTSPQNCGGGGTDNVCGCIRQTGCPNGLNCGTISDGCGGTINCGSCTDPQSCSGGGTANVCGCIPKTECPSGTNCGKISDSCGGVLDCGSCSAPNSLCADNICGPGPCDSFPCSDPHAVCSNIPDSASNGTSGRKCTCTTGYIGPDDGSSCVDADACCNFPCASGEICVDLPAPAPNDALGRRCEGCQAHLATNLTLTVSPLPSAVRGTSVTFTVTLQFASTSIPPLSTVNFAIGQQGNNREVQCNVKQTLSQTPTSITLLCVTNTLPLGQHKYHASFWSVGGCLTSATSPSVNIKINEH